MANQQHDQPAGPVAPLHFEQPADHSLRVPAPGAARAVGRPGMTPDRSTVPGHWSPKVPAATVLHRPLTQYGTAQEILDVFQPGPDGVWTKADFEQAPASDEEQRKVHPINRAPLRPAAHGYALGGGEPAARVAALASGGDPEG
jgi:hypothetical protein